MTGKRISSVLIAAVLVIAALVVGIVMLGTADSNPKPDALPSTEQSVVTQPPPTPKATEQTASRLQDALNSSEPGAVLTKAFSDAAGAANQPFVPPGAQVEVLPDTFSAEGKYALVRTKVKSAESTKHFVLHMERQDANDQWRIFATSRYEEQSQAATPRSDVTRMAPASLKEPSTDCQAAVGKNLPVLFVHGLFGTKASWKEGAFPMEAAIRSIPGVVTDTFGYEPSNTRWVDHPDIGPRLVECIKRLATASAAAGGPGKVVVVAHSMGGLATRWAAANGATPYIGKLITLGTPNLGSGIANAGLDVVGDMCKLFVRQPSLAVAAVSLSACQSLLSATNPLLEAVHGLQKHSAEIDQLPWMPASIPTVAIAGNVRAKYLMLTGVTIEGKPFDSDLIVSKKSALAGNTEGWDIGCAASVPLPMVGDADCEHGRLVQNRAAQGKVKNAIQAYLDSLLPKLQPFEFQGVKLSLPPGWKAEKPEQGIDYSDADFTVYSGDHGFLAYGPDSYMVRNWQEFLRDNGECIGGGQAKPLPKGTRQVDGQTAAYCEDSCSTQKGAYWVLPGVIFESAASDQKTREILER